MWIELDKRQCFIDIIDGKIDLFEDDVRIVNFVDDGYTEPLENTDVSTIKYLLEEDNVKLFQKVVDK